MASLADNCIFVPTAGGTGSWTVSAAVQGYQTPAQTGQVVDGKTYRYRAESADKSQWEEGNTTSASSATVFARTVVSSSNANAAVNFTVAPNVALTITRADILQFDDAMSLTATQKAQARANIDVLKKNYIINGAMMVSQENGTTAGTTTSYYPVDQFFVSFVNGGTCSVAQVASVTAAGSPNRIRFTVTAADAAVASTDTASIRQYIEGSRIADLLQGTSSAKSFTLQFGVKAPAGTYCVAFWNSATNRYYIAEYTIAAGEANTDVVKRVVVPGDITGTWANGNTLGMPVFWALMAGTNYQGTAGAWTAFSTGNPIATSNQFNFMGTLSNVFELFDVGLYEGSAAPSFQVPDFQAELIRCKRYWQKSYNYETAVGAITYLGGPSMWQTGLSAGAANSGSIQVYLPVDMRAAPTPTVYSPSTGASGKLRDGVSGADVNASTAIFTGAKAFSISATQSAANATLQLQAQWKADARL